MGKEQTAWREREREANPTKCDDHCDRFSVWRNYFQSTIMSNEASSLTMIVSEEDAHFRPHLGPWKKASFPGPRWRQASFFDLKSHNMIWLFALFDELTCWICPITSIYSINYFIYYCSSMVCDMPLWTSLHEFITHYLFIVWNLLYIW